MADETFSAADGHRFNMYVAGSDQAVHALVVVQEIFGVNSHIRDVCGRFAAAGYLCAAPALFDRAERGVSLGYSPADVARGRELRAKVTDSGALADIAAAIARLGQRRVGVVGYCWGGSLAWLAATRLPGVVAASCWYGGGIAATRTEQPHCPVQMHFGGKDAGIPLADVAAIKAAQPDSAIYIYPEAQHGFGCDARASYSAVDAALAQERTLAFFSKHLG
jgi:carboxymethylenebutenolidase